jgi:hypothetical protein
MSCRQGGCRRCTACPPQFWNAVLVYACCGSVYLSVLLVVLVPEFVLVVCYARCTAVTSDAAQSACDLLARVCASSSQCLHDIMS